MIFILFYYVLFYYVLFYAPDILLVGISEDTT